MNRLTIAKAGYSSGLVKTEVLQTEEKIYLFLFLPPRKPCPPIYSVLKECTSIHSWLKGNGRAQVNSDVILLPFLSAM